MWPAVSRSRTTSSSPGNALICQRDCPLAPTVRFVGLARSLYMDAGGKNCRVGAARIAKDTGLHLSTVKRADKELADTGWLDITSPGGSVRGGTRMTTVYRAQIPPTGSTQRPVAEKDRYSSAPRPVAENATTGSREVPHHIETSRTTSERRRSTRIPEDFTVSDEMRAWATAKGIRSNLDTETERFVDYWSSKGDTRVDWVAAWRNWLRRADDYLAARPDPNQSKSAAARARACQPSSSPTDWSSRHEHD